MSISNWSEVITLLMLGSPILSSLEGRGTYIIQSRSGVAKCSREGIERSLQSLALWGKQPTALRFARVRQRSSTSS